MGRNLDIFVGLDVFQRLLETEYLRRDERSLLVARLRTHIGEFLRLGDVDGEVLVLGVFAHYLSGIDLILREDEELAAVLQLVESVCKGGASLLGDDRAVGAAHDVALPGFVGEELVGHNGFASRSGEHVGAQTDDAARWNLELEVLTVALGVHGNHFALAAGHHIDHLRAEFLGAVDGELLDRLALLSIDLLDNDLGLTDSHLVALAAHGLDEDGKVEHTTTIDHPRTIAGLVFLDTQGHILLKFLVEAILNLARGDVLAVLAEEGRIVDGEEHRHGGLIDLDARHGFGRLDVADGVANLETFDAGHGADIAREDFVGLLLAHALEGKEFLHLHLLRDDARVGVVHQEHHLSLLDAAAMNTTHGDTTYERRVFERGDEHLRGAFDDLRSWDIFKDGVE